MKRPLSIFIFSAAVAMLTACADLGFGVDLDADPGTPYWYGNGYLGDTYWNTPVWNYGPIYNPIPPRPPLIGGPGPALPPSQQPDRPTPRPPQMEPGNSFPGINQVPTHVGGIQRPGNGGLPTGNPSGVTGHPASRGR